MTKAINTDVLARALESGDVNAAMRALVPKEMRDREYRRLVRRDMNRLARRELNKTR